MNFKNIYIFTRKLYVKQLHFVCCCLVSKTCPTLLHSHGLWPARLLCPRDSPGKKTGVGWHFLLQEIFLTQGSNLSLLIGRQILYHWATKEACLSITGIKYLIITVMCMYTYRTLIALRYSVCLSWICTLPSHTLSSLVHHHLSSHILLGDFKILRLLL